MNPPLPHQWPQFFTATINDWMPLLESDEYKRIITSSLHFMVNDNRIVLYGFVIMRNHIHLIWQACQGHTLEKVQQGFLKYTAQQIKFDLLNNNHPLLENYRINAADRKFNFWKRRSLGIELFTPKVFRQKLNYIHRNPVKARICKYPEQYHYSSAGFYFSGIDPFNMLTHWK